MSFDLNAPLAWTEAKGDALKALQNLQGNILKGHGRDFTANIFFTFNPLSPSKSKRLLRELANYHLTNAHQQLLAAQRFKETKESGGAFCHCALSFHGYQALGLAGSAPADPDFQAGMKSPGSLTALADPAVATWEPAFQKNLHAVVLVAHDTEGATAALAAAIQELIEDAGGKVELVQHGKALKNAAGVGIENFGYVDGRSQPLLLEEDIEAENEATGSTRWDPAFPLKTALIADPGTADGNSFGSLFVFRKLEQNVRAFKDREQAVADALGLVGGDRELAGALIVGRFEDGTPVTLSKTARGEAPPNDFNYVVDAGSRCPLHAHIRKSNPRGNGPATRDHIMPRRGIPYEDVKRTTHPDELPEVKTHADFTSKVAPLLPTGGVGLLFMAYNHSIGQQFRFTQHDWVNDTSFPPVPAGPHGIDPVIGQGPNNPGDQKLPKEWDDPSKGTAAVPFAHFVHMRGGEYFFSPSLTFLKNL